MGLLRQFLLLLWKNTILQIRRPVGTVVELVIPPLAVLVLIALRYGLSQVTDQIFVTFDSDHLHPVQVCLSDQNVSIYVTPMDIVDIGLADRILEKLPCGYEMKGAANSSEAVRMAQSMPDNRTFGCFQDGAVIEFDSFGREDSEISYTIRLKHEVGDDDTWRTDRTAPAFDPLGARVANSYLSAGFLHLQRAVEQSIIEWKLNESFSIPVAVRQLPYPSYTLDLFLSNIGTFLSLLMVLAFIYSAGVFTKELVLEKETRIRESMRMMGLSNWVLWTTWYIKQLLFLLISTLIVSILLKVGIFTNSNWFFLFLFFLFYALAFVSFCFFVSVWFSSASIGLIVGFFAFFSFYLPYLGTAQIYDTLSLGAKVGLCFFFNTALGYGINVISTLEIQEDGLDGSTFAKAVSVDDPFRMVLVYGMLLFDSIIYMLLAWYIDGVKPGKYGVPKPFYFPFLPSYWTGKPRVPKNVKGDGATRNVTYNDGAHEEEPKDLQAGIKIDKLRKVYRSLFSKPKVAVEGLTLNIFEDQITALLGHNGAGKTTTMSILTGLYTPTSGDATIGGFSILRDMDQIRKNLGICPQHNVLFDRLTVKEHLQFFTQLKGVTNRKKVREEVEGMIEDLLLVDKGSVASRELSGGMKRKLSVGIALIGGSKVVVLDEPTSGMDPYARRATWDLLAKHKKGRTMLLTTHFMDEADLLGDRIVIMAEGVVKCSGSSLFLKKKFGVGYHMAMVKQPHCDSSRVRELVEGMVQGGKQVSDVGAELSFILPSTASSHFPALFEHLEGHKQELGIMSFGISVTTMEEVFIKVGEGEEEFLETKLRRRASSRVTRPQSPGSPTPLPSVEEEASTNNGNKEHVERDTQTAVVKFEEVPISNGPEEAAELNTIPGQAVATRPSIIDGADPPPYRIIEESSRGAVLNSGVVLWLQQFRAMFTKRFYNSIRFLTSLFTQFILPILFVLFGLILAKTLTDNNVDDENRKLTIGSSSPTESPTFFTAQFTSLVNFNFSDASFRELGIGEFPDYTSAARQIYNSVGSGMDVSDCCAYENQILDQFCATRSVAELNSTCEGNTTFGYTPGGVGMAADMNCLSCCRSVSTQPTSCSDLYPSGTFSRNVCPSPPRISTSDALFGSSPPSGPLQEMNSFVAEHLLRLGAGINLTSFIRNIQGGFTIHDRDAPYASCGCRNLQQTCRLTQPLVNSLGFSPQACIDKTVSVVDTLCPPLYTSLLKNCTDGLNLGNVCANGTCANCSTTPVSGDYDIDGLASACLAFTSCADDALSCPGGGGRTVGALFPAQDLVPAVTVWYNNEPFHMAPAALNAFHNMYVRHKLGNDNFTITANNHPLPRNATTQVTSATQTFLGFTIGTMVSFGYSFLLATFVIFIVQERESKAKHLQFVSGVSASSYWLATLAWDMVNVLVPILITVILFAGFQVDGFTGEGLGAVTLLLIMTCLAVIPLVYLISFLFSNALTAYAILVLILFFGSQVLLVTVTFVTIDYKSTGDILHYIFLLEPTYGLVAGIYDVYTNYAVKSACQQNEFVCRMQGIEYVDNPLDVRRPGIGVVLLFLAAEAVIFFLLTVLSEREFFLPELRALLSRRVTDETRPLLDRGGSADLLEDDDVANERKRVWSASPKDSAVLMRSLSKTYPGSLAVTSCRLKSGKKAVRGISLSVPHSQCFGLLGVNGAGKTTTFKMLTGDLTVGGGSAIVAGYDIGNELRKVQQRIGYCPQFDALIDRLTGRELLTVFARLRGLPEGQIKEVVAKQIKRLDLAKHADKQCGNYSGGNKRKLSTAIALVGDPPIAFLDEPTTGLDPATRRYMWDVLAEVVREGRCIILTSHSMEECEALCTRLAIMVNGEFKCLGSIQHLKSKFSSGLTLQAKVKLSPQPVHEKQVERSLSGRTRSFRSSFRRSKSPMDSSGSQERVEATSPLHSPQPRDTPLASAGETALVFNPFNTSALHAFIKETFPDAVLMEEHQGAVTYRLPGTVTSWSMVFRKLEENKEKLGVVDYSVSQTTLEQVFINFAKEQEEEEL